jgi:competence protein ComEC
MLSFLDVGQGDATVIRFPNQETWVLDAGGRSTGFGEHQVASVFDIGEAVVSRYLWHLGLNRIDRLVLSHPHQDHAGGMAALLRNFPISRLHFAETRKMTIMASILQSAGGKGISSHVTRAGDQHLIGEARMEVLHPPAGELSGSLNDCSMVVRLQFGKFSALFTGDLEGSGEKLLLSLDSELGSTLLKVAHHGSRSATGDSFLDRVEPKWAVISASRGNLANETIQRLLRRGVTPLITANQGALFFETDGTRYRLSSYVSGLLAAGELP